MQVLRLSIYFLGLVTALLLSAFLFGAVSSAQTLQPKLKPDMRRALGARLDRAPRAGRTGGYVPARAQRSAEVRPRDQRRQSTLLSSVLRPARPSSSTLSVALNPIISGTPLSRVLHTSQLSLTSVEEGTLEQFVDRNNDLMADERTTFDSLGGAFDVAVGHSGTRYEVFAGTLFSNPVGVVRIAVDTNGDYQVDTSPPFNLQRFQMPSAAAVVAGRSRAGQEFIVVSSSGFFNADDPGDPANEPSPGIVLLIRDPNTGGFDDSRSVELVSVGDDRLFNANALALLPNNDLLVADFTSNEVRIIRDTNADGLPDTLEATPYFSSPFANEEPLDIAVNSVGVVFTHSFGNDTVLLALYDDNGDGRADRDEVAVEGLSIDNNLFLHGLTVTGLGDVYVIEDANGAEDGPGGNGGTPRVDAFPDRFLNGFLTDGLVFTESDSSLDALSGLAFGLPQPNPIEHSPDFFVHQHYRDFLNREPDAAGLAFWRGQITSCGTDAQCVEIKRINVSAAFFLSIEFQETGYLVYRIYKAAYGNLPGAPVPLTRSEFLPDTRQIGQGVRVNDPGWEAVLAANKQAFVAEFVTRPRFTTAFPTTMPAAQFVDTLNRNSDGALSPAERDQLVSDLSSGAKSRAQVLRAVAEDSDLARNEFNQAFVLMQYYGYLLRNPNALPDTNFDGYFFWLEKLNRFNGNFVDAEMVKAFITSGEYKRRFGP